MKSCRCRWCVILAPIAALVVVAVSLEWWAGRELNMKDALALATRDRSPVTYFIDNTRLHPFVASDDTNALRIVVIGDSITRGANCFFADSFGERLERLLNMNPGVRPARVDVYAQAGTSTIEQRRLLNQALKEGRIDTVVLAYCLNDTEDWSNPGEFTEWRKASDPLAPGQFIRFTTNVSRFAEWRFRRANDLHMQSGTAAYYRNIYNPSYGGVHRMEVGMRYFRDTCRENGITLCLALLPLLEANRDDSLISAHDLVTHMTGKLGIPTLDLWPEFADKTPLRMATVPGEDGHLSEIAHRIVAESIFEFLLANNFVDQSYIPANMNTTPGKFEATRLTPRRIEPTKEK